MIFCFVRETKQMTLEELDRKCYPTGFMFSILSNKVDRGFLRAHKNLPFIRIESLAALHRETICPAQKCPDASASHRKGRSSKCVGGMPASPGVCQNALLDRLSRMIGDENRCLVEIVKGASGGRQRLLQAGVLRQKRVEASAKENHSLESLMVLLPLSVYTLGNELQLQTMRIKLAEHKPNSLTP